MSGGSRSRGSFWTAAISVPPTAPSPPEALLSPSQAASPRAHPSTTVMRREPVDRRMVNSISSGRRRVVQTGARSTTPGPTVILVAVHQALFRFVNGGVQQQLRRRPALHRAHRREQRGRHFVHRGDALQRARERRSRLRNRYGTARKRAHERLVVFHENRSVL